MLGIIMLLAVVFDISEKLSEFIDNKAPFTEIIFNYYLNLFETKLINSFLVLSFSKAPVKEEVVVTEFCF